MTDVGPYTFGFLSSVTGISFPSDVGLLWVGNIGLNPGVGASVVLTGTDGIEFAPNPWTIIDWTDIGAKTIGDVDGTFYGGKSEFVAFPHAITGAAWNFFAFKLRKDTSFNVLYTPAGSEGCLIAAAIVRQLPFDSLKQSLPSVANTTLDFDIGLGADQASINFSTVPFENFAFVGDFVAQDQFIEQDTDGVTPHVVQFTYADKTVTIDGS